MVVDLQRRAGYFWQQVEFQRDITDEPADLEMRELARIRHSKGKQRFSGLFMKTEFHLFPCE